MDLQFDSGFPHVDEGVNGGVVVAEVLVCYDSPWLVRDEINVV